MDAIDRLIEMLETAVAERDWEIVEQVIQQLSELPRDYESDADSYED